MHDIPTDRLKGPYHMSDARKVLADPDIIPTNEEGEKEIATILSDHMHSSDSSEKFIVNAARAITSRLAVLEAAHRQDGATIARQAGEIERLGAVFTDPPKKVLSLSDDMAGNELCDNASEDTLRRVLQRCGEVINQQTALEKK